MSIYKCLVLIFTLFTIGLNRTSGFSRSIDGDKIVRNFTPYEYKGHEQVWSIAQDRRGIMYFANSYGVLEYDGSTWRKIHVTNNASVRSLATGIDGNIYVGGTNEIGIIKSTPSGQSQYQSLNDYIPEKYQNFGTVWDIINTDFGVVFRTRGHAFIWSNNKIETLKFNNLVAIKQVKNWFFIQADGWLMKYRVVNSKRIFSAKYRLNIPIRFMTELSENNILIGTFYDLFKFDGKSIKLVKTSRDSYLQENRIYHGIRLSNGHISLATSRGGVIIFDNNLKFKRLITRSHGLRSQKAYRLFEDHEKNLWIGSGNGISMVIYKSHVSLISGSKSNIRYCNDIIRHKKYIYISTLNGLYRESDGEKFQKINPLDYNTWQLLSTDNQLIVSTNVGVYVLTTDNSGNVKSSRLIKQTDKHNCFTLEQSKKDKSIIYVGTGDGLLLLKKTAGQWRFYKHIKEGINAKVWSTRESGDHLWLGTHSSGAIKVNLSRGEDNYKITHYKKALPAGPVFVYILNQNPIFSTTNGVYYYKDDMDSFLVHPIFKSLLKRSRGKSDKEGNLISDIKEDKNGNIWFLSGFTNSLQIARKNKDGSYEISDSSQIKLAQNIKVHRIYHDGYISWLGGSDSMIKYNHRVNINYRSEFKPIIRRVVANNRDKSHLKEIDRFSTEKTADDKLKRITIPFNENDLRFEYTIPYYRGSKFNQYQTFLKGFDNQWSEWKESRYIEYTNLPEGDYTFEVKAKNCYGHIMKSVPMHFTITPPFYRTKTAYFIYLLFFMVFLFIILKLQSRILRKQSERKLVRFELLLSKINSHFLFNAFNVIISLITFDPEKAKLMIERLSVIFRNIMKLDTSRGISLEEEIKVVKSYLDIESVRLGERLKWNIEVNDSVKQIKIPPLILQPIVENSIKYNISSSIKGGKIEILANKAETTRTLYIIVKDEKFEDSKYKGKKTLIPGKGNGIALQNIKERLSILYGSRVSMDINIEKDRCTVQMNIPLRKKAV